MLLVIVFGIRLDINILKMVKYLNLSDNFDINIKNLI